MGKMLVIEDDPDIAYVLRTLLTRAGHVVTHVSDGRSGLREAYASRPDLVILDIGLPIMDGWQVLERLRDLSDVPILLLTARGQEADKVRGLRGGADDYLTKPFTNAELVARADALLRRAATNSSWVEEAYDDGVVHIEPAGRKVYVDGQDIRLTPTEFRLLNVLVQHSGAVLSPKQLLARVWDDPTGIAPERVKFAVLRLRRKLGWTDPGRTPVEAVRGFGYRYRKPAKHADHQAS